MEEEIDTSTLAKGTIWTFLGQLLLKLFSFFYLIVLAKFFSTEEVGIFYFALSIVSVISIFTDLGLNQSLPRYIPYLYGKGKGAILSSFMKIIFIIGGFLSLFFSFLLFFLSSSIASALGRPEITPALQALAFLPLISELAGLSGGFLVGRKMIKDYQIVSNFQGISKLLFTVGLGFLVAFNSVSLGYAYLLSFLPLVIGYSYFMLKDLNSLKQKTTAEKIEKGLVSEVFYFGLILSVINAFYILASSTDRFMLGLLGGENAMATVGIYSVVTTFANLLLLPFGAILTIFFPMVSELFGKEKIEEIRKITVIAIKWSIIISAPFFILLAAFPGFLLRLFYGEEYTAGANVFVIYLLSFAIFSLSLLPMKVIAAMRRLDIELKIAATCAFLNIILNWLFIPIWGMDGAAFATLLSFLLMTILAFFYSQKLFGFVFPKESIKLIFISFFAFAMFSIMAQYISLLISSLNIKELTAIIVFDQTIAEKAVKLMIFGILFLFVCAVYLTFLVLTKSFGKEELKIMQKALRRLKVPEKYSKKILNILGGR
ncbi:MAG: flippase [Candidatus Micrarchaeia archaeon]